MRSQRDGETAEEVEFEEEMDEESELPALLLCILGISELICGLRLKRLRDMPHSCVLGDAIIRTRPKR